VGAKKTLKKFHVKRLCRSGL